jgi:hypothetical protein
MCFALRVMHNSIATEISVSLEHESLASDDQNSNKLLREEAFSRTVETSQCLSASCGAWHQWPLVRGSRGSSGPVLYLKVSVTWSGTAIAATDKENSPSLSVVIMTLSLENLNGAAAGIHAPASRQPSRLPFHVCLWPWPL